MRESFGGLGGVALSLMFWMYPIRDFNSTIRRWWVFESCGSDCVTRFF